MLENLLVRAEAIGRDVQQRKIADVAQQLRMMFGGAAVRVEDSAVTVSGRGIIKRWLIDPSLRFLAGGLK